MRWIIHLPEKIVHHFKAILSGQAESKLISDLYRGKGHSLLRLHEYQHRVIAEIFRVSIAGFFAFSLILVGFAIYSLADPSSPKLMGLFLAMLGGVLMLALYRTMKEFRNYRENYAELAGRLRARVASQMQGGDDASQGSNSLIESLKPKEYAGWDNKSCLNCHKSIELLAKVCQHCGHEQDSLYTN